MRTYKAMRVWLRVTAMVVAAAACSGSAAGGLPAVLLPDLDQRPPLEISVRWGGSAGDPHALLTFASTVQNLGFGPLIVEAPREQARADMRARPQTSFARGPSREEHKRPLRSSGGSAIVGSRVGSCSAVLACAALLVAGVIAGSAFAGAPARAGAKPLTLPKPDPPPVPVKPPPPPPPPAPPPPPPPAAIVQAPPPPAPVQRTRTKPTPRAVDRTVPSHPSPPKLPAAHTRLAVSGTPVSTSSGGSSPALLIVGFGVLLGLLGSGIAFAPSGALPREVGFRLEPHRQTILVTGLAIGVACALVGILTALAGR